MCSDENNTDNIIYLNNYRKLPPYVQSTPPRRPWISHFIQLIILPKIYKDYISYIMNITGAKNSLDTIKNALKLYYMIIRETEGEGEILIRDKTGKLKKIV